MSFQLHKAGPVQRMRFTPPHNAACILGLVWVSVLCGGMSRSIMLN